MYFTSNLLFFMTFILFLFLSQVPMQVKKYVIGDEYNDYIVFTF
jgi:hypothetical protein